MPVMAESSSSAMAGPSTSNSFGGFSARGASRRPCGPTLATLPRLPTKHHSGARSASISETLLPSGRSTFSSTRHLHTLSMSSTAGSSYPGRTASPTSSGRRSPRISKLLGAVLGTGMPSVIPINEDETSTRGEAEIDIVDGSFAAVPSTDAVTRPPSPTPTADYSIISPPSPMSFVHVVPPSHPPSGIYDVFASPTSGPAGTPNCTLFISPSKMQLQGASSVRRSPSKIGKATLNRIWGALSSPVAKRSKNRFNLSSSIDDGLPLDGEEGELIDEACFIAASPIDGIDLVGQLPPEVALHVLNYLDIPTVQACRLVCRYWSNLAGDNMIWRDLFYRKGWKVDERRAKSLVSWRHDDQWARRRLLSLSNSSAISNTSKSTSIAANPPIMLDWMELYKTRHELERRWWHDDPKMSHIPGHDDSVYCLEFDSKKIVTGSRDKTIKIWDINTGKLLATLRGHAGSVLCLKFDKMDEQDDTPRNGVDDFIGNGFMISGSSDHQIFVWNLNKLRKAPRDRMHHGPELIQCVLKGHSNGVLDLRIDKKWIVSCSKDSLIQVWDRKTFKLFSTLTGHEGPVNAVGMQDGKIVSASGDGKMMLWDIATGSLLRTFEGHDRGLACIEYKNNMIVSGSNDCKIKVWDALTGECLKTLSGHRLLVRALAFDPATNRLVSASYDKTVKVWDLNLGKVVKEFKEAHTSHVFDVKFDVRRIVSTSHDRKVCVLDFGHDLDTSLFV